MKYLSVDEQATYIDVFCDGYEVRVSLANNANSPFYIYQDGTALLAAFNRFEITDTYTYFLGYDDKRTIEIIENTPSRVVIRIVGKPDRTSGATDNYLTNVTLLTVDLFIYADRLVAKYELDLSGTITFGGDNNNSMLGLFPVSLTNDDNIYETSGTESDPGTYTIENSADYIGATADEINRMLIVLEHSEAGTASFDQYLNFDGRPHLRWNNGTLTVGIHTITAMLILDSASREKKSGFPDEIFHDDLADDTLATGITENGTMEIVEGGYQCNDSTNYLTLSTSGNLDISKGTIEFWFKSNAAFDDNADHILFGSKGVAEDAGDFHILKNTSNDLVFVIIDSSSGSHWMLWSTATTVDDNWTSWNHYRFVWDSNALVDGTYNLALYLNGTVVGSINRGGVSSSWTDATLDATIGIGIDSEDTSRDMDGIMKDLFIFDEPHAKKFSSVERLIIGDQYKDQAWPLTGQITDLNIPANIGNDGLAADGAWHVDASSKNRGKAVVDTTRHDPVFQVHNWRLRYGDVSNPTDLLVGHWKCDDNAASTTIVDETGNYDGTLVGGDNTEDIDNADAVRGTSLLLDGSADYLDFSSAIAGLADDDKFTIMITFKPNFAITAVNQGLFTFGEDNANRISVYYQAVNDQFTILNDIANANDVDFFYTDFTGSTDAHLQQWRTLMMSVDLTKDRIVICVDGQVELVLSDITQDWGVQPPNLFYVGAMNLTPDAWGAFYIDEVKLIDDCLLPYGGGPFTGNGAVDTDVAHSDILFHDEMSSVTTGYTPAICAGGDTVTVGSTPTLGAGVDGVSNSAVLFDASAEVLSIPSADNVIGEKGKISWWYKLTGSGTAQMYFWQHSTVWNHFAFRRSDTIWSLYLNADSGIGFNPYPTPVSGQWHFMEVYWDIPNEDFCLTFDGIEYYETNDAQTIPDLSSGTLAYGNRPTGGTPVNGYIDNFTIHSEPYTPDTWSVFGKPIYMPMIKKNGVYQRPGTDYETVFAPDGSQLITGLGEVS